MPALPEFQPGGTVEISVTTWNLEGTCGPARGSDLLQPGTHHIYIIGTQECERGIAASYVNSSKSKWEEKLAEALGEDYTVVASETLMAIHIIMFARQDVSRHITCVKSDRVATGLLNGTVGNKGGVCVGCMLGDTSLLFVNVHFAAHQENVEDRNSDFRRICYGANLRPPKALPPQSPVAPDESSGAGPLSPTGSTSRSVSPKELKGTDVTDLYDVVIWSGDLNYRINGRRNMVDVLLKDESYREVLLANDQLLLERRKGNVFQGFCEGDITFNPTYKYHKEDGMATAEYDKSAKARIPAWTDRILFKANTAVGAGDLQLTSYASLDSESLRVSDHRPVVASLTLKTRATIPSPVAAVDFASPSTTPKPTETSSRACLIS
eukprot:GGOE01014036.1.p1 GENE.GGOE01014036.1~~GGOE01014036.1.p1  ORF type:complete len:381 (-),score=101.23 GGOE01014036.1:91-1233(-)